MIIDAEDHIEHFGTKGMRWGVRKEYEPVGNGPSGKDSSKRDSSSGETPVQKALRENPSPELSSTQKSTIAKNQEKHDSHFTDESSGPPGWRPTPKQLLVIGVGAVAVAAIIYKVKTGNNASALSPRIPFSREDYEQFARDPGTPDWLPGMTSRSMSAKDYMGVMENSKDRAWSGKLVTKDLFNQEEFTLPAGHEFFRISSTLETNFNSTTYVTSSKEDLHRYVATYAGEKAKLLKFSATDEIRVPDLMTRLDAMHESMLRSARTKVEREAITPERVFNAYQAKVGGRWDNNDSRKFIEVLLERGYHAIVDDMDVGVYGESPLVLIDPSRFSKKVGTPIKSLYDEVMSGLIPEISNRR